MTKAKLFYIRHDSATQMQAKLIFLCPSVPKEMKNVLDMILGFFIHTDAKTFIDHGIDFIEEVIPDWPQCVLKHGSSRHNHRCCLGCL